MYVLNTKTNELIHYGVPGMKWGHKKAKTRPVKNSKGKKKGFIQKQVQKSVKKYMTKREEELARVDRVKKTWGKGGVMLSEGSRYVAIKQAKTFMAHMVNGAANAVVKSNAGVPLKKGADYVRRATITGLSLSTYVDAGKAIRNVLYASTN